MKIKLYGVRGSIASPSPETVRYGGNTACVFVEGQANEQLIFDAGTGIRLLGKHLSGNDHPIYLFFSHYHWDHIQGFPFFQPAYQRGRPIYLLSDHLAEHPKAIIDQMADPHFPIPGDMLQANIQTLPIRAKQLTIGQITVHTQAANHPGGCCAYRLDSADGRFAYITDNELSPPKAPTTSHHEWVQFLAGVDLLIHDAMYLDSELTATHGWGHSLISQVLQLAVDAQIKHLILFHHDPSRTDAELDLILINSQAWMKQHNPLPCHVYLAREGDCYTIAGHTVTKQPL